jgi:hypothetical protein
MYGTLLSFTVLIQPTITAIFNRLRPWLFFESRAECGSQKTTRIHPSAKRYRGDGLLISTFLTHRDSLIFSLGVA